LTFEDIQREAAQRHRVNNQCQEHQTELDKLTKEIQSLQAQQHKLVAAMPDEQKLQPWLIELENHGCVGSKYGSQVSNIQLGF
jgi:chromosome segregation ATPase